MAISFESALGFHEQALLFRTRRASVLANNMANINTPHFKARDLDFKAVLRNQQRNVGPSLEMRKTHSQHASGINGPAQDQDMELKYRVPVQPSIDGNTVDEHVEQAEFLKNAMQFEFSFMRLSKRFKGLKDALRGGK